MYTNHGNKRHNFQGINLPLTWFGKACAVALENIQFKYLILLNVVGGDRRGHSDL